MEIRRFYGATKMIFIVEHKYKDSFKIILMDNIYVLVNPFVFHEKTHFRVCIRIRTLVEYVDDKTLLSAFDKCIKKLFSVDYNRLSIRKNRTVEETFVCKIYEFLKVMV